MNFNESLIVANIAEALTCLQNVGDDPNKNIASMEKAEHALRVARIYVGQEKRKYKIEMPKTLSKKT